MLLKLFLKKEFFMSRQTKKVAFLTSLGAGLEYYDFIIYGMLAGTLSTLFFTSTSSWIGHLKAFAVFAVGYLIRPIGGVLFGMIGDTFGRKKSFLSVMLIMAVSTFGIGLLPTYASMGSLAAFLLIVLRLLQGLSFGAELPGAITVLSEYTEQKKRSIYSSFVISSVTIGSILASLILYLLSHIIDQAQIQAWGWRIPFLIGGLLAVVNYFIRRFVQETPEFTQLQKSRSQPTIKEPIFKLISQFKTEMFTGTIMTGFVASLVIFYLYLPTYLNAHYSYNTKDIYLAMTTGLVWSVFFMPICGYLADRFGRIKIFLSACVGFAFFGFLLFQLLHINNLAALIAFTVLYQSVICFISASYFALLSLSFPTDVRYTGIAICYNIAYSIMGCLPVAMTGIIQKTQLPQLPIWILIFIALSSGIGCLFFLLRAQEKAKKAALIEK